MDRAESHVKYYKEKLKEQERKARGLRASYEMEQKQIQVGPVLLRHDTFPLLNIFFFFPFLNG